MYCVGLFLLIVCVTIGVNESKPFEEESGFRFARDIVDGNEHHSSKWMGQQWGRLKNWFKNVGTKFRGFSSSLLDTAEGLCQSVKSALKQYEGVVNTVCSDGQFEFCKYLKNKPNNIS